MNAATFFELVAFFKLRHEDEEKSRKKAQREAKARR